MTVVGFCAWCDFVTEDEYRDRLVGEGCSANEVEHSVEHFKRGLSFDVQEFAVPGTDVASLHDERGFAVVANVTGQATPSDPWRDPTLEALERDVRTTALRDDENTQTTTRGSGSPGSCAPMASRHHLRSLGFFRTTWCSASACERDS